MASRYCPWCEVHWPMMADFLACPQCAEPTGPSFKEPTVTTGEAEARMKEWAFGWYLWDTERV